MKALRLIFCPQGGQVRAKSRTYAVTATQFAVTDCQTAVVNPDGAECYCFDFETAHLQSLYYTIADLLDQVPQHLFCPDPVRLVPAAKDVMQVVQRLANANPTTLLSFVYVYCLGLERHYFSALLRHSIASHQLFLYFIESHFLNPWPISRFAKEFGLPLRKFNLLFQKNFGTSAKHWLLVRRLNHARELLSTTSTRVLDIALECGFTNHAHFTGSFRKHFHHSPTDVRRPQHAPRIQLPHTETGLLSHHLS